LKSIQAPPSLAGFSAIFRGISNVDEKKRRGGYRLRLIHQAGRDISRATDARSSDHIGDLSGN
jgi:hypothetical protein